MDVHKNARLTPKGRGEMVRRVLAGERVGLAAAAFSTTCETASKWVERFLEEGLAGPVLPATSATQPDAAPDGRAGDRPAARVVGGDHPGHERIRIRHL